MFNIFFLAFAAIAVGILISVIITRKSSPSRESLVPPEDAYHKAPVDGTELTLDSLFVLAEKLCQENKLNISDKLDNGDLEIYWIAVSHNALFLGTYVFGFFKVTDKHPLVTLSDVLSFKDFIKSLGSSRGVILTTGYFTRDVHQPLEGPGVTLYNRQKILSELRRFGLVNHTPQGGKQNGST